MAGALTNNDRIDSYDVVAAIFIFIEPGTFRLLRTQSITDDGAPVPNINESLEYTDGSIYANQYQLPYILRPDTGPGAVVAKVDLTEVWRRAQSINPYMC